MRTYFFNLQKLPDSASSIASTFLGEGVDVFVTDAVARRVSGDTQGLTASTSQDLAYYSVFGASGLTGYARVHTRRFMTFLVPVAFEAGNFNVRVTAVRPGAGVAWVVLIFLPDEVVGKRWANEMPN